MNIEYLHEFVVLSKKLNFHEAAYELCLSQSALSKHIATLEADYGVLLFTRDRHQVYLTDCGIYLLESAKTIWEAYEQSQMIVKDHFKNEYRLSFGGVIGNSGDYSIIASAERLFKQYNERNALRLVTWTSTAIEAQIEFLKSGEMDCVALYNADESIAGLEEIEYERICSIPMEVSVFSEDAIAAKTSVGLHELEGMKFIQFISPRTSPIWAQIELHLNRCNITYSVKQKVISSDYDFVSVLENLEGVAFIAPKRSIPTSVLKNSNTAVIPIHEEDFVLNLDIIYLKERKTTLLVQFIDSLKASYLNAFSKRQ